METKSSRLTVRFPENLRRELRDVARSTGRRESDIVRDLVEKHLGKKPMDTAYDRLKRAGLIGIVKDAPKDLSTNKKYFKGFGES